MSIYLYDNAIVEYFRQVITDERVYITPSDNVVRTIARLNNDEIKLPLISLQRTNVQMQPYQFYTKYHGAPIRYEHTDEEDEKELLIRSLQAIPMKIQYSIDIWTRNREENDAIMRELLFFISTHPQIEITIPYGVNENHVFNLLLDGSITDNSDIVSHKNQGEIFITSISAYVDDAYIWKSTTEKPFTLDRIVIDPVKSDLINVGWIDTNKKGIIEDIKWQEIKREDDPMPPNNTN